MILFLIHLYKGLTFDTKDGMKKPASKIDSSISENNEIKFTIFRKVTDRSSLFFGDKVIYKYINPF